MHSFASAFRNNGAPEERGPSSMMGLQTLVAIPRAASTGFPLTAARDVCVQLLQTAERAITSGGRQ